MIGKCKFCGQNLDLRFGGCFDCAEAESIIDSGLDMWDKGINGEKNIPAENASEKLKILISKGWIKRPVSTKNKK